MSGKPGLVLPAPFDDESWRRAIRRHEAGEASALDWHLRNAPQVPPFAREYLVAIAKRAAPKRLGRAPKTGAQRFVHLWRIVECYERNLLLAKLTPRRKGDTPSERALQGTAETLEMGEITVKRALAEWRRLVSRTTEND